MLRASRRVLRRGGQIAFYSIVIPSGRTARNHRRAVRCGPPAVATSSDYPSLLRSAGFVDIDELDVTAAYLDTARAWLHHGQEFAAALAALEPPGAFEDRLNRRRDGIAAIEAGLLRRSLFVGTRPCPPGTRCDSAPSRDRAVPREIGEPAPSDAVDDSTRIEHNSATTNLKHRSENRATSRADQRKVGDNG